MRQHSLPKNSHHPEIFKYKKQLRTILTEILSEHFPTITSIKQHDNDQKTISKKPKSLSKSIDTSKNKTSPFKKSESLRNLRKDKIPKSSQRKLITEVQKNQFTPEGTKTIFSFKKSETPTKSSSKKAPAALKKKGMKKKCIKISQLNVRYGHEKTEENCQSHNLHQSVRFMNPEQAEHKILDFDGVDHNKMSMGSEFSQKMKFTGQGQILQKVVGEKKELEKELCSYKKQNQELESQLRNTYETIKQLKFQLQNFALNQTHEDNQQIPLENIILPKIALNPQHSFHSPKNILPKKLSKSVQMPHLKF